MIEVYRGSVNTWECDEMGHMNVRFYVAKAVEGLATLAALIGMPDAFCADATSTLLVREQHIRFLKEAHAGAALHMVGGVVEMGESEARLVQLLMAVREDFADVLQHPLVLLQQVLEGLFAQHEHVGLHDGTNARLPGLTRHDAHFAEALTVPKHCDVLFVRLALEHDADLAALDDEHLVATLALVEDVFARGIHARLGAARELGQQLLRQRLQKVDLLELVWSNLLRLYDREAALAWLFGLNPQLGDRRPIDLVRTGRTEELMRAIRAERADTFA